MDKKILLKKEIKKWEAIFKISQSADYQQYLKPILESAFQNNWMKPDELDKEGRPLFSTYEAFHKAYSEQYGRATAYKELFLMFENAESMIQNLTKQLALPEKSYGI